MKSPIVLLFCLCVSCIFGQSNPFYENLPLGKYAVGFKIFSFIDSSRVSKPRFDYFNTEETGDLHRKITVHLWYPARPNTGQGKLSYGDYAYCHILSSTKEKLEEEKKQAALNSSKNSLQGFYGPMTDTDWQKLLATPFLAQKEAVAIPEKFPLLVGTLRPLSTTITNELLASNGYVIAMVLAPGGKQPLTYISDVADMQQTIARLSRSTLFDENKIGTYGFSGSGFGQILLAMQDPRIAAVADIESALYGEGIWTTFSSSDYYDVSKLTVPFLHIYSKSLGETDEQFADFHKKKYAHRYHLLLNQRPWHHWDLATEGRASTTVLHLRGEKEAGIKASFELSNIYLLHFFNAFLKNIPASRNIIDHKRSITAYTDSLWSIQQYPALTPPPSRAQFLEVIQRKGIEAALALARQYHELDPMAEFIHENALNQSARELEAQNQRKEGLALMSLAVEYYPQEAWLWNNLSSMQEDEGNKVEAIRCAEKVVTLLADDKGNEQSFNQRILRSAQARLKRIK